ncbi:MAG: neutral/alkaline non-lysosomal ceramidase N-terminal domain-containing protein [Acidobacteria bacterium]|nr:neutral/alkaline non-lysosomal ceramidase N-terminal domain-containing protein [Acidobacteriota bacterium]
MQTRRDSFASLCALALAKPALGARPEWKAGLAKVAITPRKSIWMGGFGARKKPSEGVLNELYAKALALEDRSGKRAVLVTTDMTGFSSGLAQRVAQQAQKRYGLSRDRLLLNSTHTHSGVLLANPLLIWSLGQLSPEQSRDVEEYTRELEDQVVALIGAALKDLRPARLAFGRGTTDFSVNRRLKTDKGVVSFRPDPEGPVDHDVPVLRVESERGQLLGVVFGYACHPSCLMADNFLLSGDYAGFAQEELEQRHPGAAALFVQGFGGDSTTHPRGTVELARKYGGMLAGAVEKTLSDSMKPVNGPLTPAYTVFPLAFAPTPSREEFEARARGKNTDAGRQVQEFLKISNDDFRKHAQEALKMMDRNERLPAEYPYPIQAWQFGRGLTLLALAGEVVVDYAVRLKKELDPETLWLAGYSNDVFAYIPSLRVLQEGSYEGGGAMAGARLPGPFAPSIEETIVRKIRELVERTRISSPPGAGARKQKPKEKL